MSSHRSCKRVPHTLLITEILTADSNNNTLRATIALRAIVARQSTRQFTQRNTHNQNVYIVTMRAGDS